MKLIIKIIFIIFLIKKIIGFEVHIIKYSNILCKGELLFTIGSTNCSRYSYFQKGAGGKLAITKVNNQDQCSIERDITEFVQTKQCYLNTDGTSYQYIINDSEFNPRNIDTYCNEVNYFNCENYFINSYRNNTCIKMNFGNDPLKLETSSNDNSNNSTTIRYQRRECIGKDGMTINVYECLTSDCKPQSCILKQTYPSNSTNCDNFKSLKMFNFLTDSNPINQTVNYTTPSFSFDSQLSSLSSSSSSNDFDSSSSFLNINIISTIVSLLILLISL
ncbi:hypothetical protein DDB_G0286589 [Dictyostelium discoideum AX4]|uniref:Uncharacterized protein n=1 Tax=Dictyostelium discoideum TaxID=44689 RepID=Q54LL0_DICDI|nr:hypothetical protein DDB_G0286589 [Dictyostelium discoideum AX4]EAL64050.1 hypothetical protein DDB_G0286589 [Dictyostelium discoideum AX4]|eukprot:XP_637551.1 hypothetical protein DDB_G0286589 [Dictyostelium discoideum AX4]